MKEANKMNAEYVVVIGEDELTSGCVKLKKMSDGTETEIPDFKNLKEIIINENKTSQT